MSTLTDKKAQKELQKDEGSGITSSQAWKDIDILSVTKRECQCCKCMCVTERLKMRDVWKNMVMAHKVIKYLPYNNVIKSPDWEKKGLLKLKQDGKVIGKVELQFGNSLRTNAETFVIKTQSVDILISTQS